MFKLKIAAAAEIIALCAPLCACSISADSSLKELTDPYITRYECTRAEWGGQNFLDGYDYVRITLLDRENMELSYKKTGELKAGAGAPGIEFTEEIKIENGKFTISLPLLGRELIMQFES